MARSLERSSSLLKDEKLRSDLADKGYKLHEYFIYGKIGGLNRSYRGILQGPLSLPRLPFPDGGPRHRLAGGLASADSPV